MRSHCLAWLPGLGLIAAAAGCAGRFDPAHFEGSREPRRAEPEALLDVTAHTGDLETLGRVSAHCSLRPGFRRLAGEALSDLDCSEERLLIALHESAADAGGEVVVGARCRSSCTSQRACEQRELSCEARVARFASSASLRPLRAPRSVPPSMPAPSSREVKRSDEPDVSLSFRILLHFEPSVSSFEQRRRSPSEVRELSTLPIADRALGDLAATCAAGCEERALRYGVLIAAGRLGAPDVVGVRCFRSGSGNACVGTLAAPEQDH